MKLVRTLRNLMGIGKEEFAGVAGISLRTLSRLESGEANPDEETIRRVDNGFEEIVKRRMYERKRA